MEQVEQKIDLKNLSGGLEILVQLAEKGDIDPWDIDIIQVTDKFLAALDKSPRENLLNAGRAIFFASVLLRLKSDILLNLSNETLAQSQQIEDFFPEDHLLGEDNQVHLDLTKLESFIVRSSLGKQQRKRKISLGDLIFALQQAEEEEERRALRAKLRAERAFTIVPLESPDGLFDITSQDEDIEEITQKVEAIIQEHLTDDKPITLSFLTDILNSKTRPFLGLLFLTNVQKIVIEQKEIYGEVYIYKSGTLLESDKEADRLEVEKQKEKRQRKVKAGLKPASTKPRKKSIVEKIKEKITGKKEIEVTSVGDEVIDITVKETSEEVISDGNNSRESGN